MQRGFLLWRGLNQHDQQSPNGRLRPEGPRAGVGFWRKGAPTGLLASYQRLESLGDHCTLPQRGTGRSRASRTVLLYFSAQTGFCYMILKGLNIILFGGPNL